MKFKKKKGKEKNGWGGDVAFLSGRRRHPETLVVARGTPCASGGEQPRSRLAPLSKRFLLVPAINISGFANSRCIM
uniref:Uncharacterized protein n=1 Tax=Oryza nivara TaxID=4536 RepID=A0A0E0I797_ORYNI